MRHVFFAILFLALGIECQAGPADVTVTTGTCTAAVRQIDSFGRDSNVIAYTLTWTSTASGAVTVAVPAFHGTLARVVTNPGATAPSANYDVTLSDEDSIDLLATKGANRHTTTTESFTPFSGDGTSNVPMVMAGTSTLAITNAGSAKVGTITLYIER
jgi:hypothetical protein